MLPEKQRIQIFVNMPKGELTLLILSVQRVFSIFKEAAMFENVCPRASWEKMKRSVEDPVPFFGTNVDKCCQTGEDPKKSSGKNNRKVKNQDFLSLMYPVD